jgi:hypothetical protein
MFIFYFLEFDVFSHKEASCFHLMSETFVESLQQHLTAKTETQIHCSVGLIQ